MEAVLSRKITIYLVLAVVLSIVGLFIMAAVASAAGEPANRTTISITADDFYRAIASLKEEGHGESVNWLLVAFGGSVIAALATVSARLWLYSTQLEKVVRNALITTTQEVKNANKLAADMLRENAEARIIDQEVIRDIKDALEGLKKNCQERWMHLSNAKDATA